MNCKLIKELKTKSGQVFPPGFTFYVRVNEDRPTVANLTIEDFTIKLPSKKLYAYFEEFDEITMEMLEEAMYDGRCLSLTGDTVEPDGWDDQGFPSMLMAVGIC